MRGSEVSGPFAAAGAALLRRVAGWLAAMRSGLRARARTRLENERRWGRLSRSVVEAELAARLAVRSGVRLDDFVRSRVARYVTSLPVPLEELGVDVSVEGGEAVIRVLATRPEPAAAPAPSRTTQDEVASARSDLASAAERVTSARAHLEGVARKVADDLASGKIPSAPGQVDASIEQCGRPPVPHPAPVLLLRGLSLALLASTAHRMARPGLSLGLSLDALSRALARDPLAIVASALLGLGAAVSVYAFLWVAVERGEELVRALSEARRPALLGAAVGSALLLAAAVALMAIRPGLLAGPFLLVCVPLASVLLARRADRLESSRTKAALAALDWDRERIREAGERARRLEVLSAAEDDLSSALGDHGRAEGALRAIERRGAEEAREAVLAESEWARNLERLAETLAASLELDRYAFVRRASAQDHAATEIRPLRSRPAPLDPAVSGRLEAAG